MLAIIVFLLRIVIWSIGFAAFGAALVIEQEDFRLACQSTLFGSNLMLTVFAPCIVIAGLTYLANRDAASQARVQKFLEWIQWPFKVFGKLWSAAWSKPV